MASSGSGLYKSSDIEIRACQDIFYYSRYFISQKEDQEKYFHKIQQSQMMSISSNIVVMSKDNILINKREKKRRPGTHCLCMPFFKKPPHSVNCL